MTRSKIALVIAAVLGVSAATAQTLDYGALEQLFGEPVTTSVTGSPQRESDVPAAMRIITADEIRRSGARDIPSVLRHFGGIDVLQTGNDSFDVSVRGYNQAYSPRLLVLVDGRQVYADYYGFTPWSAVPVELGAIRQIEIVKGPQSALFGFNAVSGVVNIVTYDPLNDDVSTISVVAGTQDVRQGSAVSTWQFGERAGLRLSAGQRSNDDFSTQQPAFDVGTRRGNERFAVNADAGIRLGEDLSLGIEVTHSDADQAEFTAIYTTNYSRYDTDSMKLDLAADTHVGLIQGSIYSNQIDADVFNGSDASAFINFHNRVTIAQVQSITKLGTKHTLRLSAEQRANSLDTAPIGGAEVSYDVTALGGMWQWAIAPSLTLTTAYRADRWWLDRDGFVPPGYGLTNASWDRTETTPSFNVGAVWHASDADNFRFLVSRGVQLPNLLDLGGLLLPVTLPLPVPMIGYATGVPDLEPAIVKSYEIGWQRSLARLGASLDVAIFDGASRNMAANVGGIRFFPSFLMTPVNVERSTTHGIDASIDGTVGDAWRWGASLLVQDVDDDFSLPPVVTVVDFEHTTPERSLRGNVGWTRGPWEVDGFVRYQSSTNMFAGFGANSGAWTLVPVDSYVAVDGRLGFRLNERMTLALSGQNLGHSEQRQTSAPSIERQILATFSLSF